MSDSDKPEAPAPEATTAEVIPFPARPQPSKAQSPAELESLAQWALTQPRTGTISDEIAGLRLLGDVAFEACCQARFDGRQEAISIAGNMVLESIQRLKALAALIPDPVPLAEHPIQQDLEAVRSMPQSDDATMDVGALECIAMTIDLAIQKCSWAVGANDELPKISSMIGILKDHLRHLQTLLKSEPQPALVTTNESATALFAPGESPNAELRKLQAIVRLMTAAVHKSYNSGENEALPSVGITLGMLEGRLRRLEGTLQSPTPVGAEGSSVH